MKKPIALMCTDTHLKDTNIPLVTDIFKQVIELAKKHELEEVFALGDLLDSRKGQSMVVLSAFESILDMFHEAGVKLIAIAGNHDKTDYESEISFLDPFRYHPAFEYSNKPTIANSNNANFFLAPYIKEGDLYNNSLIEFKPNPDTKNYLLTHIAVNGVKNNDGSEVESGMSENVFAKFDKVFVGHYHDTQQVGKNIFYIGSTHQNNFGENYRKGFTLLYDDGSHELVESKFPKYTVYEFDSDAPDFESVLEDYIQRSVNSDDNIRFILKGAKNALKSLKIDYLKENGIDVKIEEKDVEEKQHETTEFQEYNDNTIKEAFSEYCSDEGLDYKTGEKYLK